MSRKTHYRGDSGTRIGPLEPFVTRAFATPHTRMIYLRIYYFEKSSTRGSGRKFDFGLNIENRVPTLPRPWYIRVYALYVYITVKGLTRHRAPAISILPHARSLARRYAFDSRAYTG